ncbi:MAG TPA: hypothetical protein VEU76_02075 [Candidatus Udaeobacter sp.]|nr:hypothetical protein [Candidatus Udaeobacter sp.]
MNRSAVAIILRAELLAWRNRVFKGGTGRTAGVGVVLLLGAFVVGGTVFGLADAASQFLPFARDPMLVGAFSALSILMLVVGFPTVIANFFVGTDLLQLVLAPVRPLEIFLARAILAMRANLLLGFVIFMFLLGAGAGAGAPIVYYALALVLVVLQVLLVTALQTLLLCLILQWVPARLARDVSVAVASISGAGIYLAWQVTLRQSLGRKPDVSGLLAFAQRIEWLPAAWPGHALSATLSGSLSDAAAWTGLTLVLGAILIVAAGYFYGRTVVTGAGQLGGASPTWRRPSAKAARDHAGGAAAVSPEIAIARKDWITYRRDVRRLSRLLPAVIFLIGYAVVFNRPQRGVGIFWNDVFLAAFVSMFISMAVATSAIPSERRGIMLLRISPVNMTRLLRAKILYSMLPVVGLTVVISVVVAVLGGNGPADVAQLALLSLWLGFGFVAIGVCAGAIDPRFDSVDDRRMVGPGGTLAGLGAELAFGTLSVLAFTVLHVSWQVFLGQPLIGDLTFAPALAVAFVGGALVLAAAAVAVIVFLLRIASSRLSSFEASIATS